MKVLKERIQLDKYKEKIAQEGVSLKKSILAKLTLKRKVQTTTTNSEPKKSTDFNNIVTGNFQNPGQARTGNVERGKT